MPAPYCYDYPRPMLTVDLVVFAMAEGGLRSLFIKRSRDPFADHWAIPGGYVEIDEPIADAALRELREETGLADVAHLAEIGTFGDPGRDPRGRTISVAHAALIRGGPAEVEGRDDAKEASWIDPRTVAPLAFDHAKILARAVEWLAGAVADGPAGLALLPSRFGADDVRRLLEATSPGTGVESWLRSQTRLGRISRERGRPARYRLAT